MIRRVILALPLTVAMALVLLQCDSTSPETEELSCLELTAEGPIAPDTPFMLQVVAVGSRGTKPFSRCDGTVALTASEGTIEPDTLLMASGTGQQEVRLPDLDESLTITAVYGAVRGSTTVYTTFPDRLVGDPDSPAAPAIPAIRYMARVEDFSRDHPDLPEVSLSNCVILVIPAETATIGDINALFETHSAVVVGGDPALGGGRVGLLALRLPTRTCGELEEVLEVIRANPAVDEAVQDILLRGCAVPPPNGGTPAQWEWERQMAYGNPTWGLRSIRAPQLWNFNRVVEKRGASQSLAIIDIGFGRLHPDIPYHGESRFGDPSDHGTAMAGTAAALLGNRRGIEGVSPFSSVLAWAIGMLPLGPDSIEWGASWAELILNGLQDVITSFPEVRIISTSLGYDWDRGGINPVGNDPIEILILSQSMILLKWLSKMENEGLTLPLIVSAAGNDDRLAPAPWEARYESPINDAGIESGVQQILVVEALKRLPTGQEQRWERSFTNGHISAPGVGLCSTVPPSTYACGLSGTSFGPPQVAGLAAYLLCLDATLTTLELRELIVSNAAPLDGEGAPRIDAWASALDIDRLRNNDAVLRMMVDIDDGTVDGNQRTTFDSGSDYTEDAWGDGRIDMSDFRRWRDWLLQVEPTSLPQLDGSATHKKKDVNGNGVVEDGEDESLFPYGDFNGDGTLGRTGMGRVPGALNRFAWDLDVLQAVFEDEDYTTDQLPGLIDSGDLTIWPRCFLALPEMVVVTSTVQVTDTGEQIDQRNHGAIGALQVYTLPIDPGYYTARVEAFDWDLASLAMDEKEFVIALGGDIFWDPPCGECIVEIAFPETGDYYEDLPLTVRVGRELPDGSVLYMEGLLVALVPTFGIVDETENYTDASGYVYATAQMLPPANYMTIDVIVRCSEEDIVQRQVTAIRSVSPGTWLLDWADSGPRDFHYVNEIPQTYGTTLPDGGLSIAFNLGTPDPQASLRVLDFGAVTLGEPVECRLQIVYGDPDYAWSPFNFGHGAEILRTYVTFSKIEYPISPSPFGKLSGEIEGRLGMYHLDGSSYKIVTILSAEFEDILFVLDEKFRENGRSGLPTDLVDKLRRVRSVDAEGVR
ncbi:MAG: S8 family serine peptidase [Candidatus Eisenbacteria sp.]|nr:S8 family serine peptidase [Candidatus Eisenbacteria bacterium]